uniref:MAM domain-containing protein n=1 Tax=Mola mola TaxID=94237 RepID=A0A3Q3WVL5_MOLML
LWISNILHHGCVSLLAVLLLCGFLSAHQPLLLPGSCNFELGTCGYTSDREYASWRMNEEGHLITVESAFLLDQEQAVLVSPVLDHQDWSCARLVYQITGRGSLQFHLRPDGDNFDYRLWTASKESDSWLIANVDLPNTTIPYQILLEGRPERGSRSSVAIFEIHIVPGYCIECNFEEHHLCGYSNSWNPNVNWYVGGSSASEPESSPPGNQTNNNQRGHHMYVDSVYAKHFQEVAKLTSPMTTAPMAGCLSFYYHRDQERGNIFSVFTRDQLGHYEEIWRPEVYVTAGWRLVSVDIKAPHPLEVVFEVAFNSAKGGYVAIDDITFSPDFCHTDTEPTFDPSIANCDFEDGLCLYYQESSDSKVWSRVSVKPNAYRMGDHTTGAGRFLLANARFMSMPGYLGRLHGPFLPGNHKYCLRFYYLLFEKVDSALVLYIYDEHNVALEKVWSLYDSSGSVWNEVEITYMKPMTTKVVFASICRNFWECGLVAIDDITVSLGDCQITAGSLPGQCNFESGVCGYFQDRREDEADWLRVRGHTPTSYTGPRGDHTSGVGYFMYIEASLMRPGHKARLLTSDLRGSSSQQCLTFYYHMYGSGTGILSVLLRAGGREQDALLWRRRGEQGIGWMRATVDYHCDIRHQIIFEAIRGPSLRSDIALDDIIFERGPCEDPGDATSYSGSSDYFNEVEK